MKDERLTVAAVLMAMVEMGDALLKAEPVSVGYGGNNRHDCDSKKSATGYSCSGRTQYKIAVCSICDQHLGVVSQKFLG